MNMKEYHDCYFQLLSFEKNFRQFTQTKIGNSGLTFSHIIIMSYLHDHGGCGQKELTVTFNSSSAAMAVSVARLEEKGLIRKVVDDADKRNNWTAKAAKKQNIPKTSLRKKSPKKNSAIWRVCKRSSFNS